MFNPGQELVLDEVLQSLAVLGAVPVPHSPTGTWPWLCQHEQLQSCFPRALHSLWSLFSHTQAHSSPVVFNPHSQWAVLFLMPVQGWNFLPGSAIPGTTPVLLFLPAAEKCQHSTENFIMPTVQLYPQIFIASPSSSLAPLCWLCVPLFTTHVL